MRELVDVLSTTEGGEHMAQTLKKYTEGSYAGIFDQQTNVELDNQMIVFQIRDLEDQLRPIAMYVILNFLWNRIRADFKKRILVIDEAWSLMQHEDSARFLYGLIKRARKYFLGVTTITQDVEDFVNSPYGKPIITNASLQILLKQSASAVDNLQKLFYLTDGEKYLLLNSAVGQGVFFAGGKHVAIEIVASPQEEELITTKPEEVLKKKKAKKEKKKKEKEEAEIKEAAEKVEKKAEAKPKPEPEPKAKEKSEPEPEPVPVPELEPEPLPDEALAKAGEPEPKEKAEKKPEPPKEEKKETLLDAVKTIKKSDTLENEVNAAKAEDSENPYLETDEEEEEKEE